MRVKDLEFERGESNVRDGKGPKRPGYDAAGGAV